MYTHLTKQKCRISERTIPNERKLLKERKMFSVSNGLLQELSMPFKTRERVLMSACNYYLR